MFYKHNYKKEEEKEKENVFIQKIQKIRDMDMYTVILIIVPIILILLLGSYAVFIFRTNKKAVDIKPQTMVQSQILSKEKFDKKDVYLNETAKLNSKNFELFISEKDPNKGIIPLKSTDFINNNNKVILYKATKKIRISGNSEILKKLRISVTGQARINFSLEAINIELDPNQKNNSILYLELNSALLEKEQILENNYIVTVAYEESYVE